MKPSVPFEKSSYLAQVRRLRNLAGVALQAYPIKIAKIKFLHHGENATFCVEAVGGRKYLLRILRGGYHTKPAVLEELRWLQKLAQLKMTAPRPVKTRKGDLLHFAASKAIEDGRQCCLFEWIDGTFLENSVRTKHMYELGRLLAELQKSAPPTRHRRYWTAEGLLGETPKFGRVDKLLGVKPGSQKTVIRARPKVLAKLRAYQKRFPNRLGYIHADLHFGNIIKTSKGLAPIDFDDSGYGFHVYDLIVPFMSATFGLGPKRKSEVDSFRTALIAGYSSGARWDEHDDAIFDHLIAARRIAMLGWLNSRSDNPRLKARLAKSADSVAEYLKSHYSL